MTSRRSQSGFTLIELMMVVAILGVIASVAIPSFQNVTMRTKAAERKVALAAIKNKVTAYFTVHDSMPGEGLVGEWNPYPYGTFPARKLPFRNGDPGWNQLDNPVEGTVYYTYRVVVVDTPGLRFLSIASYGDLDGDGAPSEKELDYDGTKGPFQLVREWPEPSAEGAVF